MADQAPGDLPNRSPITGTERLHLQTASDDYSTSVDDVVAYAQTGMATDAELAAAVSAHAAATDPHGDRAYAAGLVDDLSGVSNASQARTNLGLGTAATAASSAFDAAGTAAAAVAAHEADTTGVHGIADTSALLDTSDIGVSVQAYDADIATVAASQAEMEAGTETALRSMSPLRVAQAISALGGGGGGGVAGKVPIGKTFSKKGVPGLSLQWGGIGSVTSGYLYLIPFCAVEDFTLTAYHMRVDSNAAGRTCDLAIMGPYTSFASGATGSRVTGTLMSAVDLSTAGNVTATLASPVTISAGWYAIALLPLGGNSSVWQQDVVGDFYNGASVQDGNAAGGVRGGRVVAVGQTAMPSSVTMADTAVGLTRTPVTLVVS